MTSGATSKIRCPEDFGLIGNQLGWSVQRTKPDSDSIWAQLDIAPVNLFENGKYGAGPSYYIISVVTSILDRQP